MFSVGEHDVLEVVSREHQLYFGSFCLFIRGLQIFLSKDANGTSLTALATCFTLRLMLKRRLIC